MGKIFWWNFGLETENEIAEFQIDAYPEEVNHSESEWLKTRFCPILFRDFALF